LVLADLDGVAGRADDIELLDKLRAIGDRIRRPPGQLAGDQCSAALGRAEGQENLAERRAVQRIGCANARLHAQRTLAFENIEVEELAAGKDAEIDRLVEALAEPLHMRPADLFQGFIWTAGVRKAPQSQARAIAIGLGIVLEETNDRECLQVTEDSR